MKKELKKEMFFNKISLWGVGVVGILVGIVLILISYHINFKDDVNSIIQMIGQTVISISVSSLLLEWFGYVNYTQKRMCEILAEDEVINILDMKRKRELKSALIKNIYMPNANFEENNIATIVDDEMDKVLKGYYYDEYITYIDAYKQNIGDNTYIQKDIRVTFTAKSVKGDKCIIERLLSTYLKNIKDQNDKSINPVILKKLVVNGNDITDEFKNSLTSGTNEGDLKSTYPNSYSLDKNNNNFKKYMTFKDSIYVDMEYSTLVDMTDLMYSHQIDKACKHYCMHFNVKPNEFDITVLGFGFMSLGNTKRQRCVETNNGYMLRFLDWILPGDGVCVMLNSKN